MLNHYSKDNRRNENLKECADWKISSNQYIQATKNKCSKNFGEASCWKRLSSKMLKNETVKTLNIIGFLSILWSSFGEAIQFYWNNTIFGTNSNIVRSSI